MVIWVKLADIDAGRVQERGEFVVILGPIPTAEAAKVDDVELLRVFNQLSASSLTEDQVLTATAAVFGLTVPKTRTSIKKATILVKRQSESVP